MATSIHSEIKINASPEEVWKVLTDFPNYHKWNSFIKSVEGDVKEGNTIVVKLQDMTFKPQVLVFEANKEFRWKGKLLFKGLFDGEHRFILHKNNDGTTIFEHGEEFSGLLVPLLKSKLMKETKPGFEQMNKDLEQFVTSK